MLLLFTIRENLYVGMHSDDAQATALACTYFAARVREQLERAVAGGLDQPALAASLSSMFTDGDRVALASWGFTGVAVAQVFESAAGAYDHASDERGTS